MNGTELIRSCLMQAGLTQKKLAEHMGWSPQNLSGKMNHGTLTYDEVIKALEFTGHTVTVTTNDGRSLTRFGNSSSPKVVQCVDNVTYDTSKSESICSNKKAEDDPLYMELFRDGSGRYFFALYQLSAGCHNTIIPASKDATTSFYRANAAFPVR